ncbi:MAG TPA: DUF4392 domain-containing protein [Desulfobacteraceae bacterium]|nr:DUF4392 domain-containing protein [Desulfobacteraceae bacterium]
MVKKIMIMTFNNPNGIITEEPLDVNKTADHMEALIQQDPGRRGLSKWAVKGELFPAAASLATGKHIIVTTGFYIPAAKAIETDGPPGAIVMALALMGMGKKVTFLIDPRDGIILRRGLDAVGCTANLLELDNRTELSAGTTLPRDTTHFIAVERPGRARNGCLYNSRGCDLSSWMVPLDDLFIDARSRGIVTLGMGDGGNELGLGRVSAAVDWFMGNKSPFSCITPADFTICAGVSNWGGYATAALLSIMAGIPLLPEPRQLEDLLSAITTAGAVDGITNQNTPSVDGLDPAWESRIFQRLWDLTQTDPGKTEAMPYYTGQHPLLVDTSF